MRPKNGLEHTQDAVLLKGFPAFQAVCSYIRIIIVFGLARCADKGI